LSTHNPILVDNHLFTVYNNIVLIHNYFSIKGKNIMFKKLTIYDLTRISLFTALICVSSYIKIELPSAVPITAQTLAVMLAGSVLTPKQAAFSLLTYLLLGAIGAPIFAGGAAGLPIIFGKTGGYLIGFLVGAVVISLIRGKKNNLILLGVANIIGGIVVVDLFGALWFSFITGMDMMKTFVLVVLPYLPGDLIKVAAATIIANRLNKYLKYNGNQRV
jgi:biotin transport system substrate-specific component